MNRDKVKALLLPSLVFAVYTGAFFGAKLSVTFPGNLSLQYWDYVQIPAVQGEEGNLFTFRLYASPGNGRIYISSPPIFDKSTVISFLSAEHAVCKIYSNCSKFDYYIDAPTSFTLGKGPSGSAGIGLIIYSFLKGEHIKNRYPITGFLLPNGIVAPVGGIPQKLEATEERGFSKLVAPGNEGHILPIYSILQYDTIFYGEPEKTYTLDGKKVKLFDSIMKAIAEDICQGVNDSDAKESMNAGDYYTAASLCFMDKSSENKTISSEEIRELQEKVQKILNSTKCSTPSCEEIKYQVFRRYRMAESLNGTQKYWRLVTALQWSKFLNVANQIKRKDTCDDIREEYYLMSLFAGEDTVNESLSCYDMRENLANLYTLMLKVDESNFDEIRNLVYYCMNKYGFSIPAYAYINYAEYWLRKNNTDYATYYALLALEYAE